MKSKKIFYLDLAERVAVTFVQGFLAFWIITGDIDADTLVGGLVAGGLSAAKAFLAMTVGDSDSAALLPSPPDHSPGGTVVSSSSTTYQNPDESEPDDGLQV